MRFQRVASSAIVALVMFAGCAGDGPYDVADADLRERTRFIEATPPEELSRAGPSTLTRATTQAHDASLSTRPATRPAAPPVAVTLADVRVAALANNLDLAVELVNPRIAQQVVDEEEAKFESTFFGSAGHAREHTAGLSSERQNYELGLRVPLRTGGTVAFVAPFSRASDEPAYAAALQFSISQPLLRDAGVRVNAHSIRLARLDAGVVDARTKLEVIRILADADRVYWRLYAARAELRVRQQQYELAVRQLNEARKRVAAEAAPRIEITRAESGVAARLESIIVAETRVRFRERDLKRMMHRPDLPPRSGTPLVPTTVPTPVHLDLAPEELAARAVVYRMEMLELELLLAADASNIDFARNQALPLFVLDYTYAVAGTGDSPHDSLSRARELDENEWAFSVSAEIPIGNAAAKARLHRAILGRAQRLATRDQRRFAIEQEVYDTADLLAQNWQRILAARNESLLAGRTYEAERRQFELGVRTTTDVLDAAERLAAAQSREIQALTDYQIAQVDLAFATGTLLGHDRIHLREN